MSTLQSILEITDLTKSFPGEKALDYRSSALKKQEVRALLGEIGVGKTIIYILYREFAAECSRAVAQTEIIRTLLEGN